MSTPRRLTLLASLTVQLMLGLLATIFARTKQQPHWTQPPSASTPPNGPTHTGNSWSTIVMSDCDTPEEGDRIHLGPCDRCNGATRAGALWVHYGLMLPLELCGHHDRDHRDALTSQGWERARLDMGAYRQGAAA